MYWWGNFDAGEVREEFSVIKEIGLTVVRPSMLACQPVVFIWFLDIDLNKNGKGNLDIYSQNNYLTINPLVNSPLDYRSTLEWEKFHEHQRWIMAKKPKVNGSILRARDRGGPERFLLLDAIIFRPFNLLL